MPKNQAERIIDARRSTGMTVVSYAGASGGSGGVDLTAHLAAVDPHAQYLTQTEGDGLYVPLTRAVTAGAGLTNGGALSADITLNVGAGEGIVVNADNVALNSSVAGAGLAYTAGVLAVGVATTLNASGAGAGLSVETDLVRLTASSNPGTAAAVLASDSSGHLTLQQINVDGYAVFNTINAGIVIVDRSAPADTDKRWVIYSQSNAFNLYRNGDGTNIYSFSSTGGIATPAHMTLVPIGDLIIDPASNLAKMATGVSLQSDNYASQLTGWRATHDGQADFRYIYTDELHAKSFIADLEQALAGGQIISKSVAMVAYPFEAPAPGAWQYLYVRDLPSAPNMAVFQAGDIVRLRTFSRSGGSLTIADCWGVVTAYEDGTGAVFDEGWQRWRFDRSAAPNAGAMTTGATVPVDSLALDYGTSGNGFHEVNAIDGLYGANSPYSQIVTWSGHPATGQTLRTRMGNLYGLFSVAGEYGLFAGNGTANSDPYLRISSNAVRLNNIPLTLYNGATQTVNISATGTDIWVGPSSSDKRLSWDGTTLTVNGAINVTGGNAATQTYASSAASTAQTNAQSYTDTNAANLGLTNVTHALVSTTLITGGNIRVGSGTKDSTLDGWHIDIGEIVGQLDGADQVVMGTDGKIKAGANAVWLDSTGLNLALDVAGSFTGAAAIKWSDGLHRAGIWANAASPSNKLFMELGTQANQTGAIDTDLTIGATPGPGGTGRILLIANGGVTINGSALWHAGNDGSGSGLDADLLDGLNSTAFARPANAHTWTDTQTFSKAGGRPAWMLQDTSGTSYGFALITTGALATATSNDSMYLWHVADNIFGLATADAGAWGNIVLQPDAGKVGIGTGSTAPAYTLEVNGTVHIASTLTTGGAIGGTWSTMTTQGTNGTVSGRAAQTRRFGDLIFLRGAINPADDAGPLDLVKIATSTHWPARDQYVIAASDTGAWIRLMIRASDGMIISQTATTGIGWISFDSLCFFNA